ncbi:MAG: translocation/assembly module TamB domain-containing protein [Acidobacteriota bacterium]
MKRRLVVYGAVVSLMALTLALTVGKPVLEEAVREQAVLAIAAALGTEASLDGVDLELLPLRIRGRGLEIDGTDGEPVLRLEEAIVGLSLRPLLERRVVIDQIELEAPRVALRFDEQGRHNVPLPRGTGGGDSVDVTLGGIIVRRGEIVLRDRRIPLDVETGAFGCQVTTRPDGTASTSLRLVDVQLAGPGGASTFDLSAALEIGAGSVELETVRLQGAQVDAGFEGGWTAVESRFALAGQGRLEAAFLRDLGWMPLDLEGAFDFVGDLAVESGQVGYRADVSADRAQVFGRAVTGLEARAVGAANGVEVVFSGSAYDGSLQGRTQVALGEERHLDLRIDARELDLARLAEAEFELGEALGWQALAARARGRLEYSVDLGSPEGAVGTGSFAVEPRAGPVPVTATLPFEVAGGVLRSDALRVSTQGLNVGGDLAFDLTSSTTSGSLSAVSTASEALGQELFALLGQSSVPAWWPRRGDLQADLGLGTLGDAVAVRVDAELTGLREGLQLDRVEIGSLLHEGVLRDLEVRAQRAEGRIEVRGELPLAAPSPVDQLSGLRAEAASWPLASALPDWGLTGDLSGSLTPADDGVVLEGRLMGLGRRLGSDVVRLSSPVDLSARWTPERFELERLRSVGSGRLDGRGVWRDGALQAQLEMSELELVRVAAAESSTYRLGGSVAVGGRPNDPEVRADVRATGAEGREIAWLRGSWIDGIGAFDGRAPGLGDLELTSRSTEVGSALSIEVPEVDWAGVLSEWPGAPDWLSKIEARSSWQAEVELPREGQPRARLTAPVLDVTVSETQLSLLEPAVITWGDGRLGIDSFFLESADASSEVFLVGEAALGQESNASKLDLRLQAAGPAAWLDVFDLPLDVEGRMELLATVEGSTSEPLLDGVAALREGVLRSPDFPYGAEEADVVVLLYPDRAIIDRGVADLAGGRLRVEGEVSLPDLGTRLRASVDQARLNYPDDWSIVGDADVTLLSEGQGPARLRGQVRLDQVRYDQDFQRGLGALLRTLFEPSAERVAAAEESSVEIDLDIQGDRALQIENNIANLEGDFALRVRGDPLTPRLFGDIDLRAGGRLDYGGEQYVIQRGRLAFDSPYSNEPQIDIAATTKRLDYTVSLTLSGTRDRLQASLTSDPPLPELDVWSLLASGDVAGSPGGVDGLGTTQLDRSSVGAEALLYGQASNLVEDRVSRLFGLDRFRLNPIASGDSLSSARVTVGKRFSRDIFVTYSVDPNSTDDGVVEVEWRLTDRVVLVLSQNADGSYSAIARLEQVF